MTTPDITTRLRESAPENPPAFPRDERYLGHNGMTLRDYFAGKAVVGILSNSENVHVGAEPTNSILSSSPESFSSWVARVSYLVADAMLAHRSPSQIEEGKENG